MADETFTIEVYSNQAAYARSMLRSRVRLRVTEKRHWFFWVRFAITGPGHAVRDARAELDRWLDMEWLNRQW